MDKSHSFFPIYSFILLFFSFSLIEISPSFAKPIKIGFLLSTLQTESSQQDKKYFAKEIQRLGGEAIIEGSDNNESVQLSKLENLLAQKVDAVVIRPVNSATAAKLVDRAKKADIPVVAYDRLIENVPYDLYITQDDKEVGRLQAEAAVKATGGQGHYVILLGPAGENGVSAFSEGVKGVLKNHPKIKVVMEKNHEKRSSVEAKTNTEKALANHKGKIDAILADSSEIGHGAIQAVLAYDKKLAGKIFVAGAGADLTALKNVVSGYQQMEVIKDSRILAEKSAQAAFSLANREKILLTTESVNNGKAQIPVIKTPVIPVTKDTLEEVVIKGGLYSREEVFGK